jgi:hypothetical protein
MQFVYRVAVLLSVVGCYSPSYSNCSIACTDSCPNSLTCDSQLHVCRVSGTTCSGDAGLGSDAAGDLDARSDAPADAPGGCRFVQEGGGAQDGGNLNIDFNPVIAQGDFVVVAIAGRGPSNVGTVSDGNGQQLLEAVKSQVTSAGAMTTSAIYYIPAAPAAMPRINISWTGGVTQTVIVGEWKCGAAPSAVSRTGLTSGQSAGTSTDTGSMMVPARSLVVSALAYAPNVGTAIQTAGFTLLDQITASGTSGSMTGTAAWGVVEGGTTIDVTFSTMSGSPFAATSAAFTVQ